MSSASIKYPTGDGYLNPTLKALLANSSSGGGTTTPTEPVDLSGYVTTGALTTALATKANASDVSTLTTTVSGLNAATPDQIQKWIRGNGLFRGIDNVYGTATITDNQWQNFVAFPYLAGDALTFSIVAPSPSLGAVTDRFVPVSVSGEEPPRGTWTLLINPNNTANVTIQFVDSFVNVVGRDINGTYAAGNQNFSFQLPQGRCVLIVHHSLNFFYYCFL